MTKQELDKQIQKSVTQISADLSLYLLQLYADNPISDKAFHGLIMEGGLGQQMQMNLIAGVEKVLFDIEQRVLRIGSGLERDANGQKVVAGFVSSVDNEPKPTPELKPKEETKEAYLKATLSLLNSEEYCPKCSLPLTNKILCTNCGTKRL